MVTFNLSKLLFIYFFLLFFNNTYCSTKDILANTGNAGVLAVGRGACWSIYIVTRLGCKVDQGQFHKACKHKKTTH